MKRYCVYIVASKKNGTLYIGITSDLLSRIEKHRDGRYGGFTKQYGVKRLVYFEEFSDVNEAILREKKLKRWRRRWKVKLIEKDNKEWKDLYRSRIKCGMTGVLNEIGPASQPEAGTVSVG